MLVELLIALLILGFVFWLLDMLPLQPTIKKIIQGVGVIIAILLVLKAFGLIDRIGNL